MHSGGEPCFPLPVPWWSLPIATTTPARIFGETNASPASSIELRTGSTFVCPRALPRVLSTSDMRCRERAASLSKMGDGEASVSIKCPSSVGGSRATPLLVTLPQSCSVAGEEPAVLLVGW
eukprot:scaffold119138_cov31-Tisochrysis_lutea.AAC.3